MSRQEPVLNTQVLAALEALTLRLGRIPTAEDIDDSKSMPLDADDIVGRFGSLYRALLEAHWFRQPSDPEHEPIDIRTLSLSMAAGELLNPDRSQVFRLVGPATIEELLRKNALLGQPVGGLFGPDDQVFSYGLFMRPTEVRLLDVTASARAYEVLGGMVLQNGEPYPGDIPAAMVVVYDLTPHGWIHEGRFGVPAPFNLDDYVEKNFAPAASS